jgi:membrane fusion protein (multidrug efflux system)
MNRIQMMTLIIRTTPPNFLNRGARAQSVGFLLLLVAILSVGGFHFWNYLESFQDTDDAQVDGYLDPLSSRINGTISAVYVDNNQSVKAGQLLVQLDPRDYQVAVEQARAQLAQARAEVNSTRQQYVAAVATVRQADAVSRPAQRAALQSAHQGERRFAV